MFEPDLHCIVIVSTDHEGEISYKTIYLMLANKHELSAGTILDKNN